MGSQLFPSCAGTAEASSSVALTSPSCGPSQWHLKGKTTAWFISHTPTPQAGLAHRRCILNACWYLSRGLLQVARHTHTTARESVTSQQEGPSHIPSDTAKPLSHPHGKVTGYMSPLLPSLSPNLLYLLAPSVYPEKSACADSSTLITSMRGQEASKRLDSARKKLTREELSLRETLQVTQQMKAGQAIKCSSLWL